MKATLVIPTYNEAAVIAETLQSLVREFTDRFTPQGIAWEIIVVDNASTDQTADVVRGVGHPSVRPIVLTQKGKGHAVRTGFSDTEVDIYAFTDADLSVSPEAIADAIHKVAAGQAEVLIGSRAHPDSVLPGREWWRTVSSAIFNQISRAAIRVPFRDTQCPLKVMRKEHRDLFLRTKETTWFFDAEFLALLHALHIPVTEVPVDWTEHRYAGRKSKLSTTRDGLRALVAFWRIRNRTPKQVAQLRETLHNGGHMQWILVGLGNPGGAYAATRHNAGRIALEAFARQHGFSEWNYERTHDALISRGEVEGHDTLLVLPETYMNASGKSLTHLVKYKEQSAHLIVVHDDTDLPLGSWRFAYARGAGGQKGVLSIMELLKTKEFVRLRIGVGKEGAVEKAGDIVLEKFLPEELAIIERIGVSDTLMKEIASLMEHGLEYSRSRWQHWKDTQTQEVPPSQV